MTARKYLRDPWMSGGNISRYLADEIQALPGFDSGAPLLDNVIRLGWGDSALAQFNADGRPGYGSFQRWASEKLEGASNL
jgi:hypothetical protein